MGEREERESRLLNAGDVQRGLREVGAEVAMGRPGLFVGRSSEGFCFIAGAASRIGVAEVGQGVMVAVAMNREGLRILRARIDSLLGDAEPPTLPDGLVIQ